MLSQIKGAKVPNSPDEFPIEHVLDYYDGPRLMLQRCEDGRLFLMLMPHSGGGVNALNGASAEPPTQSVVA